MSVNNQVLIEKLNSLPPQRRAEVEDFVDFLQSRESDRRLIDVAAKASEPAVVSSFPVVYFRLFVPKSRRLLSCGL